MYGVITSRLHCFARICTRKSDFIERSRIFLREFLSRGYSREETTKFVARFCPEIRADILPRFTHSALCEGLDEGMLMGIVRDQTPVLW